MADKKISALTALAQGDVVVSTDVLPIVDTSATETKKIAVNALVGAAAAAGLTNVDINSGTIDGTTIATSDITVGSGKTLNVSAGTLTLADNQISGDKVEGGTINAITINTLTSTAVNATTVDATNVEVTNIKAKDGTAAATIADSTGVVSLSANPTLSGGTANGVLYLNGSKVATSGSALTFDGTTLANINSDGTGFSTQSAASNFSIMRFGTDSVNGYAFFQSGKSGTGTTLPFAWRQDSTELMRLTSTGLGIGTSSPARRLSVLGANAIETLASFTSQGTDANAQIDLTPTGLAWGIVNASTTALAFSVAGSTKALINSSGNLGIGTSSPSQKLSVLVGDASQAASFQAATGRARVRPYVDATSGAIIDATNAAENAYLPLTLQGSTLRLLGGGGSGAVLDSSGNLGIGTSSPLGNLNVGGAVADIAVQSGYFEGAKSSYAGNYNLWQNQLFVYDKTTGNAAGVGGAISFGADCGSSQKTWLASVEGVKENGTAGNYSGNLVFRTRTNGDATLYERMRLDSSGNLGLGVTPSAWGTFKAFQTARAGLMGGNNDLNLSVNGYYDGSSWRYIATAAAALYNQSGAAHTWYTIASGTAGNAMTLGSAAMTLDADGDLGVGTTSPANRLEVVSGTGYQDIAKFRTGDSTAANNAGGGFSGVSSATAGSREAMLWLDADGANFAGGDYFFIQKFGNSGIVKLIQQSNAAMTFEIANTERARITSGGDLLVGTTTGVIDTANFGVSIGAGGAFYNSRNVNGGSAVTQHYGNEGEFRVMGDGDALNTNGSYGTISDARLKQDIVDAPSQWDDIKAVRFRKYRMKSEVATNPDAPALLGVVAQELEEVCPGLVSDANNEDGTTTKTVKSSILLMKAAVALQEAMARIESLEAKVAALESK